MNMRGNLTEKQGTKRRNWTREETILAFDLYCKIPFSKVTKSNEKIIELAKIIDRTPSSVVLKLANLAHFDKELRSKNITGMSHGSKLDEKIWNEFCINWEDLSYQAQKILAERKQTNVENMLKYLEIEHIPAGEDKERMMKTRIGQYFFRLSVLSAYSNRCCVTGMAIPELLIASHIKPWKDSDIQTERTNPRNGLCLNALHDKAFDKGLITIDDKYNIIVSEKLKDTEMDLETKKWIAHYDRHKIMLPDRFFPDKKFIEYHNDMVFIR